MSAKVIRFPTERAAAAESVGQRIARLDLARHEAVCALAICSAVAPELVARELDYIELRRAQLVGTVPQNPQA